MKFLLSLLAFASICCASAYGAATDVDCGKFEEVYDDLGALQGWSFISTAHPPPRTMDEYKKRCTESEQAIKTMRLYNAKCNTALTKQVVSAILETRQSGIQDFCTDGVKSETALKAINCLHDKAIDKVKQAETRIITQSQVLHESKVDDKERLKRACCAVLDNKTQFLAASQESCAEHKSLFESYLDSYTSNSMSLICPDAEKLQTSGECSSLKPLPIDGVSPKNSFFLAPIIRVVKQLDHPSS